MRKIQIAFQMAATAAVLLLAGCGKSEDASYTTRAQDAAVQAALNTPLPPSPAWAASVLGRPLSAVAKGATTCKGAVDVTMKHAGARGGNEVQGWSWDEKARQPPARILLVDAASKIVGAGEINRNRPDVPKALAEVKSAKVGWTAITHSVSGVASVMGLSSTGAMCAIGTAQLS